MPFINGETSCNFMYLLDTYALSYMFTLAPCDNLNFNNFSGSKSGILISTAAVTKRHAFYKNYYSNTCDLTNFSCTGPLSNLAETRVVVDSNDFYAQDVDNTHYQHGKHNVTKKSFTFEGQKSLDDMACKDKPYIKFYFNNKPYVDKSEESSCNDEDILPHTKLPTQLPQKTHYVIGTKNTYKPTVKRQVKRNKKTRKIAKAIDIATDNQDIRNFLTMQHNKQLPQESTTRHVEDITYKPVFIDIISPTCCDSLFCNSVSSNNLEQVEKLQCIKDNKDTIANSNAYLFIDNGVNLTEFENSGNHPDGDLPKNNCLEDTAPSTGKRTNDGTLPKTCIDTYIETYCANSGCYSCNFSSIFVPSTKDTVRCPGATISRDCNKHCRIVDGNQDNIMLKKLSNKNQPDLEQQGENNTEVDAGEVGLRVGGCGVDELTRYSALDDAGGIEHKPVRSRYPCSTERPNYVSNINSNANDTNVVEVLDNQNIRVNNPPYEPVLEQQKTYGIEANNEYNEAGWVQVGSKKKTRTTGKCKQPKIHMPDARCTYTWRHNQLEKHTDKDKIRQKRWRKNSDIANNKEHNNKTSIFSGRYDVDQALTIDGTLFSTVVKGKATKETHESTKKAPGLNRKQKRQRHIQEFNAQHKMEKAKSRSAINDKPLPVTRRNPLLNVVKPDLSAYHNTKRHTTGETKAYSYMDPRLFKVESVIASFIKVCNCRNTF